MSIQLHSWPRSSGTRIAWALEELGLPYDYVEVDQAKEEHRSARYLALNPHGKVPTLVEDGQAYFESAAILLHLGERHGPAKGLWPTPSDPAHADALCWTVWGSTELGPYLMQYLYHGMDTPFSYEAKDRSAVCAEYNQYQLMRCLDAL
jgi:glutathione S-transferase